MIVLPTVGVGRAGLSFFFLLNEVKEKKGRETAGKRLSAAWALTPLNEVKRLESPKPELANQRRSP